MVCITKIIFNRIELCYSMKIKIHWFCKASPLLALFIFHSFISYPQQRFLDSSNHLLRTGNQAEWAEFENIPVQKELTILFNTHNQSEQALSLRQYDVKQDWNILLNDQKIGSLVTDGNAMRTYFKLLPGKLKNGENKLTIQASTNIPDDIMVSEFVLHEQPVGQLLTQAAIEIEIIDRKTNKPIPARITIVDSEKILQSTGTKPTDQLAVRPGFIYTANGKAFIPVPAGKYIIYAGRGFEYSVDSATFNLKAGQQVIKKFILRREVETSGWVSSDTHIHTLTHSGHGDASDRERAVTIAGEGIELPIITEHNLVPDFGSVAKAMKLDSFFTSVHGDEVTTAVGHFNTFPLMSGGTIPNSKVTDWKMLSENLSQKENTIVILNHGRDIHNGFRPFDQKKHIAIAGLNLDHWKLPANAMEVVNSGALQDEPMRLFNDWFGMMNRGFILTPVGASDSHDVSRYLVGQARTYIRAVDTYPGNINIEEAVKNFRQGRVMISFGLLTKVIVNKKFGPGDLVPSSKGSIVEVEVAGPSWIKAEQVSLYANGIKIREEKISNGNGSGTKWKGKWKLTHHEQDVFLVVIAEGSGEYLPFWPIVKPFQPVSNSWKPYTLGSSGAIWIDVDRDGKRTPAYEYAKNIISRSGKDVTVIIKDLEKYDEAVAIQAAAVLHEEGVNLSGNVVLSALSTAGIAIKEGFRKFQEAWLESKNQLK